VKEKGNLEGITLEQSRGGTGRLNHEKQAPQRNSQKHHHLPGKGSPTTQGGEMRKG